MNYVSKPHYVNKSHERISKIHEASHQISHDVWIFGFNTRLYVYDGDDGQVYSIKIKKHQDYKIIGSAVYITDPKDPSYLVLDTDANFITPDAKEVGTTSIRYGNMDNIYYYMNIPALKGNISIHHIAALFKFGLDVMTALHVHGFVVDHIDQCPYKSNALRNIDVVTQSENIRRYWQTRGVESLDKEKIIHDIIQRKQEFDGPTLGLL